MNNKISYKGQTCLVFSEFGKPTRHRKGSINPTAAALGILQAVEKMMSSNPIYVAAFGIRRQDLSMAIQALRED